jgi:starch synthase (maltosyl-transferring)
MTKKTAADDHKTVPTVPTPTLPAAPTTLDASAAPSRPVIPEPTQAVAAAPAPAPTASAPAPKSGLAAKAAPSDVDGRKRVIIEGVAPMIDGGRFPIKRTVGDSVVVEADVFTDGHDSLSCILQHRKVGDSHWREVPMQFLVNDRWRGEFQILEVGSYEYTLIAWVDPFKSWRHDLSRWVQAEDIVLALRVGEGLVEKPASVRAVKKRSGWRYAPRRWSASRPWITVGSWGWMRSCLG